MELGSRSRNWRARLRRLLAADARNIARDPLFAFAAFFALAPALALRFAADPIDAFFLETLGVDAAVALIAPSAALTPAFMVGWMAGFLLLEERDEGVLSAVAATPVGSDGFLAYRMAFAALVCLISAPLALFLIGPRAIEAGPALAALFGLFCAAEAVLIALALTAFASNKVEGLAVTKLINLALLAPILAALETPLKWLAAPLPPFWIGLLADAESPSRFVWATLGAAATHALAIALALRLYRRRGG